MYFWSKNFFMQNFPFFILIREKKMFFPTSFLISAPQKCDISFKMHFHTLLRSLSYIFESKLIFFFNFFLNINFSKIPTIKYDVLLKKVFFTLLHTIPCIIVQNSFYTKLSIFYFNKRKKVYFTTFFSRSWMLKVLYTVRKAFSYTIAQFVIHCPWKKKRPYDIQHLTLSGCASWYYKKKHCYILLEQKMESFLWKTFSIKNAQWFALECKKMPFERYITLDIGYL